MTTIQLAFEITATCQQTLEIVDNSYNEESIIQGLKDGSLCTTTWIDSNNASYRINYLETLNGDRVAKIISQKIDGEYTDYR